MFGNTSPAAYALAFSAVSVNQIGFITAPKIFGPCKPNENNSVSKMTTRIVAGNVAPILVNGA